MKLFSYRFLSLFCMLLPYIALAQDETEEDPDGPPLPPDVGLNGTTLLLAAALLLAFFYYRRHIRLTSMQNPK